MDFLFKVAYYAGTAVSGLLLTFFVVVSVFDPKPSDTWRHTAISLTAAAFGFILLYVGFRVGHQQGEWLAGFGLSFLSLIVAGAIMLGGLLMFTKIHWQ